MKVRESGMPEMIYWESLFDIELIFDKMQISDNIFNMVEFGCGYGTFTIPAAQKISGNLLALDIDDDYLKIADERVKKLNLKNIRFLNRDFIQEGTGQNDNTVDYVMMFNILHHANPDELLLETKRILKVNGKIGVIHWNYDETTPRGPSMSIRLKPELVKKVLTDFDFKLIGDIYDLPPYHYGFIGYK